MRGPLWKPKNLFRLVKRSLAEWREDKALRLGAAVSFYAILSLPSILVIVVFAASQLFGRELARARLLEEFGALVGEKGLTAIDAMMNESGDAGGGVLASALGIGLLLVGATGVFAELQGALNTIWEVKTRPAGGVWGLIKTRLLSLNIVVGVGFLLIVSLVVSAAVSSVGEFWGDRWAGFEPLFSVVDWLLSLAVLTLLFALLFRRLPDTEIPWRDVWVGAAVTAVLFTAGKFAIGLYLGRSGIGDSYGAAGPLVVLLIWIYYSSQALFLGAEFTQVYANEFGSRLGTKGWGGEDPPPPGEQDRKISPVPPLPPPPAALLPAPARRPPAKPRARGGAGWGTAALGASLGVAAILLARRRFRR